MIPEELEKVLEANKDYRPRELTPAKPFWAILYLMPTYHNPCGYCLPAGVGVCGNSQAWLLCTCICSQIISI